MQRLKEMKDVIDSYKHTGWTAHEKHLARVHEYTEQYVRFTEEKRKRDRIENERFQQVLQIEDSVKKMKAINKHFEREDEEYLQRQLIWDFIHPLGINNLFITNN